MKYKALKNILIGDTWYMRNEIIDAQNDRDWAFIVMLGDVELIDSEEVVADNATTEAKPKLARVEKAGVWYKVYDENGNQIGKPTRDETEAELIKIEYDN